MARRKEPNKKQPVNRVPRKVKEEDITLGSRGTLPEDEKKSIKKKGDKLEVSHTRKPTQAIDENIRKGRASAKEKPPKEPKDRHVPRKSDIQKEYTKEMQKLRNRMKYREKQGFFVKWETLPSRLENPTEKDIEMLKSAQIVRNELGEIEFLRTEYDSEARQDRLRLPSELLPSNLFPQNEEGFSPPAESTGEFDVVNFLLDTLRDRALRCTMGEDISEYLRYSDVDTAMSLSYAKVEAFNQGIELIERAINTYPIELIEKYYYNQKTVITQIIEQIYRASKRWEVIEGSGELNRYLYPH